MKRTDRLMAILIAMMQGPETAQSLASKFEVSKRTILRDMQSLSEMGIPLYSMTGPAGGFRLMEGFLLPPLQLDTQEALTVIFALQAMTKLADSPFNQARWTALDKIKTILPSKTLKAIQSMLEHLEVEIPERRVKTPHLSALLDYTGESKWLGVLYRSVNHRRWLELLPRKIYTAHGFWYCEAFSVLHKEHRSFRVDRFEQIEVIDKPVEELQQLNRRNGEHSDQSVPPTRIAAKLTYRGALLTEQDVHVGECVKQVSDDEWEIDYLCPASEWAWAVRFFFTLGMDAEVLAPESLREEIYQLADQLGRRYKPKEQTEGAKGLTKS
ncbi:helix-turn-helix transcriptional regulator [Paenibacillus tarimensis]